MLRIASALAKKKLFWVGTFLFIKYCIKITLPLNVVNSGGLKR